MKKYFTLAMFLMAIMLSESALSQRTAEVIREEGEPWVAKVNGNQVYSGLDMILAIQTAINNLTQNRTEKEVVNVRTSGSTGRHSWNGDVKAINLPSNTIIDFHDNTMNVNDDAEDNIIVPIRAIRANNIEVRNMRITGNPRYGIWIFGSENVILENIHISIPQAYNIGLGIRIQERDATWSRNVTMDNIYVEHSKHHGVEIWNTDGLSIGTVTTQNTGGCGLLLNSTRNATVQLVDAYRANHGGGYAGLRFANNCGPNVVVEKVIANSCGRGVFSVSGSHGITINEVDIYGSTNQGILIEDTKDFTINGGVVKNSSSQGVRITSRSSTEHHASSNVLVQNLRVYDDRTPMVQSYGIQETTPRTNNNKILNNDLRNGGRTADLAFSGPGTIAEGNILTGMEPPTTNIPDLLADQTIAIYPNPSNGSFTIHSSHLTTHVEFKIEIFDLQGRLAFSDKKTFTGTIDLNTELNSGVYLIKISNNNDIFSSRLIISR